jgi:acyl-CoA synthetase (AMP-forming)/AMP-acid ligase II
LWFGDPMLATSPSTGSPATVASLVRGGVRRATERNAIEWDGGAVTFAEFDRRTDALGRYFQAHAARAGGRIGIFAANRVEWIEAYIAGHKAGVPVVPINHRYRTRELGHILADASVTLVVHDGTAADDEDVQTLLAPLATISVGPEYEQIASADGHPPDAFGTAEDVVVYTSGTTSFPKGVVYTRNTQIVSMSILQMVMGYDPSDRFLLFTPLSHRAAQPFLLLALALGAPTYLLDRYSAANLAAAIEERGTTAIAAVPTAMRDMLALQQTDAVQPMRSVRHIVMTGENLPARVLTDLVSLFPNARFGNGFGSTEAGLVTFLDHEYVLDHPGSCGRALQGVEVRVVDDDGTDRPVGEPGEVLVRAGEPGTYTVAAGYLGAAGVEPFTDADGWFHTGDVATVDADGFYSIVGRKKDMILSGGMNIAPREVEEIIAGYPGVEEVAVTGEPDERFGERVVAWIVQREGWTLTAGEIVAYVQASAASYKQPRVVRFIDALPRSATGKVLKRALTEEAQEPQAFGNA